MATNHLWPSTCTDTQLSIIAETAAETVTCRPRTGDREAERGMRVVVLEAGGQFAVCDDLLPVPRTRCFGQ